MKYLIIKENETNKIIHLEKLPNYGLIIKIDFNRPLINFLSQFGNVYNYGTFESHNYHNEILHFNRLYNLIN
jgi:hypothetical protein